MRTRDQAVALPPDLDDDPSLELELKASELALVALCVGDTARRMEDPEDGLWLELDPTPSAPRAVQVRRLFARPEVLELAKKLAALLEVRPGGGESGAN